MSNSDGMRIIAGGPLKNAEPQRQPIERGEITSKTVQELENKGELVTWLIKFKDGNTRKIRLFITYNNINEPMLKKFEIFTRNEKIYSYDVKNSKFKESFKGPGATKEGLTCRPRDLKIVVDTLLDSERNKSTNKGTKYYPIIDTIHQNAYGLPAHG